MSFDAPAQPIHLLVLVHGMWGNPDHLAEMNRIFLEQRAQDDSLPGPDGETLHTLVAETNRESSTYDGIDWGGERVAEEVFAEIKKLEEDGKKVTRFSMTGYSLGGLIARYVVGILHQRKFFDTVTPVNFCTVATPHIGLPLYPTFRSRMFHFFGTRLLSRTGEQFYAIDKWSINARSLLEVMADPERIFYQALCLFPHIRFYANAVNDTTVPYLTAAIALEDPFADHETTGMKIEFDEQYSPIIKSYHIPDVPPIPVEVRRFSKEWWSKRTPQLPPIFPRTFPWNVLIMVALPILLPTILTLIFYRLSKDSRSSRNRLKVLESDESFSQRLVNTVGKLEKRVEDAVVEYMDDPGPTLPSEAAEFTQNGEKLAQPESEGKIPSTETTAKATLTDVQRKIVKHLNALPNLKKELAFIHPVLNSHAVVVARDIKRFKHHTEGQGVLRHLADNFVM